MQIVSGVNEGDVLLLGCRPGHHAPWTPAVTIGTGGRTAMFISDLAIKRPVITIVTMLVARGLRHRRARCSSTPTSSRTSSRRSLRLRSSTRAPRPTSSNARSSIRSRKSSPASAASTRSTPVALDSFGNDHRPVRLREGPPAGDPGDPRRDLQHPERSAARDGGADPDAVRSGRPADRVDDAVVDRALTGPELTRLADPDITRRAARSRRHRRSQGGRRRRA